MHMDNPSGSAPALPLAPAATARRVAARAPRSQSGRIARWIVAGVLVVNLLVGLIAWFHAASAQSARASADLGARLPAIEAILAHLDLTDPSALTALQNQIVPARADMLLLLNSLPFGGRVAFGPWAAPSRALSFGIVSAGAVQAIIAFALDLGPSLAGLRDSVLQGASAASPAGGPLAGQHHLTLSDVHAAQGALRTAIADWSAAQAARAALSPDDLAAASPPGLAAIVQRYDQLANSVTLALAATSAVLDFSPALLGLSGPGNVLLLEQNADIARPTGGAIQHYAVLRFADGGLAAPVQFKPVSALDCPHTTCPAVPLPASASWSPLSNTPVRLAGANLDPELGVSGYVMQRDFTAESGVPVLGVILVTPALLSDLLGATGPVTVPALRITFSAANAQGWLSYFHRNPTIALSNHQTLTVDADTLLAQAIAARLTSLTLDQRTAVGTALVRAVATKDLQFFSSDPRIEAALAALGAAGSVRVPHGDSLYVVDTNSTGLLAAPFVHESVADSVQLDAEGGATHALRITYGYDARPQGLPTSGAAARYGDVVRVVVPNLATDEEVVSGCAATPATQAYHSILACQFSLAPGQQTTISFAWYVPNVYTPPPASGSAPRDYELLIQRQAGSAIAARVTVTAPAEFLFAHAAPPGRLVASQLQWAAAPLLTDTALSVAFLA
jgi:hypothetical protein